MKNYYFITFHSPNFTKVKYLIFGYEQIYKPEFRPWT